MQACVPEGDEHRHSMGRQSLLSLRTAACPCERPSHPTATIYGFSSQHTRSVPTARRRYSSCSTTAATAVELAGALSGLVLLTATP